MATTVRLFLFALEAQSVNAVVVRKLSFYAPISLRAQKLGRRVTKNCVKNAQSLWEKTTFALATRKCISRHPFTPNASKCPTNPLNRSCQCNPIPNNTNALKSKPAKSYDEVRMKFYVWVHIECEDGECFETSEPLKLKEVETKEEADAFVQRLGEVQYI